MLEWEGEYPSSGEERRRHKSCDCVGVTFQMPCVFSF